MHGTVSAPVDWIRSLGELRLPPIADHRLQELMDLNNEGELNEAERREMASLVEMSQELSLVRATALRLLGRTPE